MTGGGDEQRSGRRRTTGEGSPDAITDVIMEAPGLEEVAVVPWPTMWRRRFNHRLEGHDRYPWFVLGAALFGLFSVGFSITVLSIALDDIALAFGTSENVAIWVITGPLLLGALVTPAAGKLADVFGARRVYLVSMACVALFAALAAISWSAPSLILFRTLGGSIGAATGPAAIALINRLFPREKRAQALGYWALVAAGGPVLGVVAGGPVVQAVGWRWIFVAQVPLSLLTLLVCAAIFPETPRRRVPFDTLGAILLGLGTGSFVIALNRGADPGIGWSHPVVIAGLALSPVLLATFVWYERRITDQLIPTKYFARRNFSVPIVNVFFTNFGYMGGFFLTALLLQQVLGYSDTKAGLVSIVRPAVFAVAGPLAGWAATKVGERTNGVVGGLCLLSSMLVFASVGSGTGEVVVFAALALSGAAMGITTPAMAAAIANTVHRNDLGVAGGAEQMIAQLGVVVGTQIMFTVQQVFLGDWDPSHVEKIPPDVLATSYSRGYLVGAVAAALAITSALFVRSTTKAGRLTAEARTDELDDEEDAASATASSALAHAG